MAVLNDIRALFAQCPVLKDLEAVSYTHLDVYKRQVRLQPHLAAQRSMTNEAEGLAAEEVPAQLGGAGIRRRAGGGAEACAGCLLYTSQASARPVRKNKRGRFGTSAVVRRKVRTSGIGQSKTKNAASGAVPRP